MKFKVGDRVAVSNTSLAEAYPGTLTVISVGIDYVETEEAGAFKDEWLEHEDVYNSPLYKALHE